LPAFSHKTELSLAAHLERDNTLSKVGEERLTEQFRLRALLAGAVAGVLAVEYRGTGGGGHGNPSFSPAGHKEARGAAVTQA